MPYNQRVHDFGNSANSLANIWVAIGKLNTVLNIPVSADAITYTYAKPRVHPTTGNYYIEADETTIANVDKIGVPATDVSFPEPGE